MNYKLSKREQMLLKVLGVISVLFLIYFIEMRIISNLSESREALSNQVQTFNASKQQLSQLKDYEDKIRNRSSVTVFTNHLDEKNYTYQNKEDLLEVTMLSETNLIELIPNFYSENKMKRTGIAGIFAASLELTKEGIVSVQQDKIFEKVMIKKV